MDVDVEVAVVGGGPAGAATALRLARAGVGVTLCEASRYEELRMGETLPPAANPLLRELGVWDRFRDMRPIPSYRTASVWGGAEIAERSFVFNPYGNGWHVDRAAFDRMLAEVAAEAGAAVRTRCRVRQVTCLAAGFELVLADGRIRARAVVDATGRGARFARALGADRRQLDRLVCVSRVFAVDEDSPLGDTLLEAVPDGWWYASPLPGGRRLVACFTDAGRAARLAAAAGWAAALACTEQVREQATGRPVGPVRVVSAASHHLRPCAGPRWLAVGDAALAVDPLSSGGVTFALRSAAGATAALLAGCATGYAAFVDAAAEEYRAIRTKIYGWEGRFTASPFWQARRVRPCGDSGFDSGV
jgi:flavin-dependent dehydrogenase